ncbi:hypothetical protein BPOR_1096g00050 [Botrytis porri]|uniref:Uncharacterized protein n=1 Tax=Botrytis porri TaxID=87229 RepID=A0A4Z1KDH5_9HELO|nr:hypothetical protein BPOR_1096g00050 [Botrytis porri]
MFPIQPRRRRQRDKKLRSICIRARIRHRQYSCALPGDWTPQEGSRFRPGRYRWDLRFGA